MPTKFADIAKGPGDLLGDDYTKKVTLKCKKNAGDVGLTFDNEMAKGAVSSKIAAKFSYAKFSVDKLQFKGDGGKIFESSLKLTPELKFAFKASKGADLSVDYTKGDFYGTGSFDVMGMSTLKSSACLAMSNGLTLGGNATYGLSGAGLSAFSVGASYASGPGFGSITATDKLGKYNLGLLYKVNDKVTVASETVHTQAAMFKLDGVGGQFKLSQGTLKAKVDGDGLLSACFIKDIATKVTLTVSGAVKPTDLSTFKPGLAITM